MVWVLDGYSPTSQFFLERHITERCRVSRFDDPTVRIEWGPAFLRGVPDQEAATMMEVLDLRDRVGRVEWLPTVTGELGEESQRAALFFLAELRHPALIPEERATLALPSPGPREEEEAVPAGAAGAPRPDRWQPRGPPPPGGMAHAPKSRRDLSGQHLCCNLWGRLELVNLTASQLGHRCCRSSKELRSAGCTISKPILMGTPTCSPGFWSTFRPT
ncbi:uncharacterized protein LOC143819619 [Paroedura picta]|uniref:uncharacterized protein LOC143819619 n=1 Tax=Paroedura picta TaxID=143630 RepID=UPI004056AE23